MKRSGSWRRAECYYHPAPSLRIIRLDSLVLALLACAFGSRCASAAELTVGPGKTHAKPSLAAAAAHDGDTILINAETYTGDVCAWTLSNLTIKGVGGRPLIAAAGHYAWGKGTWVFASDNTTVEDIEFSGAAVPDKNGAGIHLDGSGMTVRRCWPTSIRPPLPRARPLVRRSISERTNSPAPAPTPIPGRAPRLTHPKTTPAAAHADDSPAFEHVPDVR